MGLCSDGDPKHSMFLEAVKCLSTSVLCHIIKINISSSTNSSGSWSEKVAIEFFCNKFINCLWSRGYWVKFLLPLPLFKRIKFEYEAFFQARLEWSYKLEGMLKKARFCLYEETKFRCWCGPTYVWALVHKLRTAVHLKGFNLLEDS